MKNLAVALAAFTLAIGAAAIAKPKHSYGGPAPTPATGQPGQVPLTVNAPGALINPTQFVWDGGPGSAPSVQIYPIIAPSFHFIAGGEAISLGGVDGGGVPGVIFEEYGSVTSATSPVSTVLNRIYVNTPVCTCTLASGGSPVSQCNTVLDAGGLGGTTDLTIATLAADGGTFNYDCHGY